MLKTILEIFWLLLPAGLATCSPVWFKWLPILNYPVDFNLNFRGKRLLGDNKTYRGFFIGIVMAIIVVHIQKILYSTTSSFSLINYSEINVVLFGFLLGFGALFGDAVKSFFKRQRGIKPGVSWPPFDQIDWIVGTILLASLYISIPWQYIIIAFVLFGLLHPMLNLAAYYLHIKKDKF